MKRLVVMIGPSGSGKSTYVNSHYKPESIVSLDSIRQMIYGSASVQGNISVLLQIQNKAISERVKLGYDQIVIDNTSVTHNAREDLLAIARRDNLFAHAFIMEASLNECLSRAETRGIYGRRVDVQVIKRQYQQYLDSMETLASEGFHKISIVKSSLIREEAA